MTTTSISERLRSFVKATEGNLTFMRSTTVPLLLEAADALEALTRSIPTAAPDDAAVERVAEWPKPKPSYSTKATFDQLIEWLSDVNEGRWSWTRNSQCKYVDIRIDTRSGAYALKDRDGNDLLFSEVSATLPRAALTASIPPTTAQGEVVQADAIERLGETLYRLSDKLRKSSFLHDQENHSAYEAVVAAFQRLTPAEAPTTTEPSTDDEWAARDLARAIRLKVTSASWREGELIAMCMDALRDHRLAFSHPSCEVERLREALRSARDCITYLGFGRPTDLTSVLSKIDAALSTPETVSLKGDRV